MGADRERLAVLVHEVRSPVAALAAVAEAYRRADGAARRQLAALAVAACSGIERVVSDSRLDSIVLEAVDVGRLVEEAVAAAALQGGDVRAEVERETRVAAADRLRLRQAIDNLISNALTHAASGGVLVGVRSAKGVLVVFVTDRGPGIPAGEQERIFEAGVRLDAARPGSGLGLALARAIAQAHGGTLTVDSEVGRGATFALTLPLAGADG
jgi:two-component system, OmpR family, sensor histidine kinase SenX3